jgi:uncharacterized Rmd1/YagE family protein
MNTQVQLNESALEEGTLTAQEKNNLVMEAELQSLAAYLTTEGYDVDDMSFFLQIDGQFNIQIKRPSRKLITLILEVETEPVYFEVESSNLISSIINFCSERNQKADRRGNVNLTVEYGI